MHFTTRLLLIAICMVVTIAPPGVSAQNTIVIDDRGATVEFPNLLSFTAHIESSAEIERVVLEYGVDKLTCGTVTARAFPDFTPGTSTDVTWTWEMRQSGSEPPGARIWYRWHVIDSAGTTQVSDEQRVVWLDDQHNWRSISRGMLTLHWYHGPSGFAEELLASAVAALAELEQTTGVAPESPIDLYIYGSAAEMRDATLYEPGWTGGQAFPDYDSVIIGISPEQIEWGKRTIAHELTHVLVGHLTFSCLGSVPTWLNEGIAVYGEGGLDPLSAEALEQAIATNQLLSLRALSGGFSEHPGKADLSYSQSYSVVNYLISEYGSDKLLELFGTLRDGLPIAQGLTQIYGFGLDELEDRWRVAIGAPPRQAEGATPTATAVPTPVPTYAPIAAVPRAPVVSPLPTVPPATAPPATEAAAALQSGDAAAAPAADTAAARTVPWRGLIVIVFIAVVVLLILTLTAVLALLYSSHRKA